MCAPFWGVAASCLCAICDEIISHDLNMGTCWVDQTPVHQESCALGGQQSKARQCSAPGHAFIGARNVVVLPRPQLALIRKFTVRWEHDLM